MKKQLKSFCSILLIAVLIFNTTGCRNSTKDISGDLHYQTDIAVLTDTPQPTTEETHEAKPEASPEVIHEAKPEASPKVSPNVPSDEVDYETNILIPKVDDIEGGDKSDT
jgi:hypothetical protein